MTTIRGRKSEINNFTYKKGTFIMKGLIYKTTCQPTLRSYIGTIRSTLQQRRNQHTSDTTRCSHKDLHQSIRSIFILSVMIVVYIGCSKPENKEAVLSPSQLPEEIVVSPPQPSKEIILRVTGPIYTTFELLANYEIIPRDKPVWVIGYIISERSPVLDRLKICSLDAFTTDPEKLKGGVFHIKDLTYHKQAERLYFQRTGNDKYYLHLDVWRECKEIARSQSNLVVGKKFAFKVELKSKGVGRIIETASDVQLVE